MPRPDFESLNTIQMSLQSAEQHLHHNDGTTQLQLSCALINIARGSCIVVIRPDGKMGQSPFGNIQIPAERPVTLVLTVVDKLSVSQDGLLFIDDTLDTAVTDIFWILPVK